MRSWGRLTLATKVTLLRIAGVPLFGTLLHLHFRSAEAGGSAWRLAAMVVFVLVVATDALDGWLARSRDEVTPLGQVLDPLADKLLVLTAVVMLTRPWQEEIRPQFPPGLALFVFAREVFLILGHGVIRRVRGRVTVRPRWSGKAATFLVAALVFAVLLPAPEGWIRWLARLSFAGFALSWGQYLVDGARQLRGG